MSAAFVLILALATSSIEAEVARLGEAAAIDFDAGRFDAALRGYLQAERLLRDVPSLAKERASILFLAGWCHEKLGALREARASYEQSLALPLAVELRARAEARLEEVRRRMFGRLVLQCEWAYAEARVEEIAEPAKPCGDPFALPEGAYTAAVSNPSGPPSRFAVTIEAGRTTTIAVARPLEAIKEAPVFVEERAIAPWIIAGASAIALSVSAVSFGLASSRRNEADAAHARYLDEGLALADRRAAREETIGADRDASTGLTVSLIALIAGAAAGGVAAFLWARED